MKRFLVVLLLASACFVASPANAQSAAPAQTIKGPDERFKTDILVVVAHPDDEGGVTPYLARAIYDEHKRVAVVFATRGGSGGNDYSREHGPALADIREQEARQACAKLGITNVWFLDGKDTASQNVLNSLANWGHGANLEALVRIVRLTRPEVIISWLPGIFIGENHGDHQAAGVLATEAFDMAGEPATFPAQVAGASKRLEAFLENLTPWRVKKLYFFSDADDQKRFAGTGPAYSVKEISRSQKKPYWRLAMDAATPHLTQFPQEIHQMTAMSDEQLNKFMDDPQHSWWTEPMTLILGRSLVSTKATDDVFAHTEVSVDLHMQVHSPVSITESHKLELRLGGPWGFYQEFRKPHWLGDLPAAKTPEIAIKAGSTLLVPVVVEHSPASGEDSVQIRVEVPEAWRVETGAGTLNLPNEKLTELLVEILTPVLSTEQLKTAGAQEVIVRAEMTGKPIGEVRLRVLLKASTLSQ